MNPKFARKLSVQWVAVVATVLAMVFLVGCTSAAPSPTAKPAEQPKAAEPAKPAAAPTTAPTAAPTKAPAAPTAVPAKKVEYPEKGKTITMMIPWPAGGSTDVLGRTMAGLLEKEWGVPVVVENKAGASTQLGLTDLAKAKPDGSMLGLTNDPTTMSTWLDAQRKATYTRTSFQPVALYAVDTGIVAVKKDSKYQSVKELMEDAKANPEKVKLAATGNVLSGAHLAALLFQKAGNVKYALVTFDGGAPAVTALLGGHVDALIGGASTVMPQVKSGDLRVIGVTDKEENKFHPGVKTVAAQGYPLNFSITLGISVVAGTPMEIVNVQTAAVKKLMQTSEFQTKLEGFALAPRYLDPAQYTAFIQELEKDVKPFIEEFATQQK